jgi:hypothetical protein
VLGSCCDNVMLCCFCFCCVCAFLCDASHTQSPSAAVFFREFLNTYLAHHTMWVISRLSVKVQQSTIVMCSLFEVFVHMMPGPTFTRNVPLLTKLLEAPLLVRLSCTDLNPHPHQRIRIRTIIRTEKNSFGHQRTKSPKQRFVGLNEVENRESPKERSSSV